MTETLLALVPDYGVPLVLVATLLAALALPIPATLLLIAGGAFAATGDLPLFGVAAAALTGAVVGDQLGFALGRWGGAPLLARLARKPSRARVIEAARTALIRRGTQTVFLTRWLLAPVGPWVNLAAGAMGMTWARFTLAGVVGEVIWVVVYMAPGYWFAAELADLAATLSTLSGLLAAAAVTIWLGRLIWQIWRDRDAA